MAEVSGVMHSFRRNQYRKTLKAESFSNNFKKSKKFHVSRLCIPKWGSLETFRILSKPANLMKLRGTFITKNTDMQSLHRRYGSKDEMIKIIQRMRQYLPHM